MATPDLRFSIQVAASNGSFFSTTLVNDFIMYTESNSQSILLSPAGTEPAMLAISSNATTLMPNIIYCSNANLGVGMAGMPGMPATEALDVVGNLKVASNLYALRNVGVGTSNPSYPLSVVGNINLSNITLGTSNSYFGINTSTPTEMLNVVGAMLVRSNLYILSNLGVGLSNPSVPVVVGNGGRIGLGSQFLATSNSLIGVGTSNPTQMLTVAGSIDLGSAIIASSNSYIGINTNAPTESLAITGNVSISSNVYAVRNLGIGTSNLSSIPGVVATISGDIGFCNLGQTFLSTSNSRIGVGTSNPTMALTIAGNSFGISNFGTQFAGISNSCVGVGTSVPNELLTVSGNLLGVSNAYVGSNIGIGKSNPSYSVDVVGDVNYGGSLRQNGIQYNSIEGWTSNNANVYILGSNVGVGTTANNPIYNLDLTGTLNVNKDASVNNKLLCLYDNSSNDSVSTACNFFGFGVNTYRSRYQVPLSCQHQWYVGTSPCMTVDNSGITVTTSNIILNNSAGASISMSNPLTLWSCTGGNATFCNFIYTAGSTGSHSWFNRGDAVAGKRMLLSNNGKLEAYVSITTGSLSTSNIAMGLIGVGISPSPSNPIRVNNSNFYSLSVDQWLQSAGRDNVSDRRLKTNISYLDTNDERVVEEFLDKILALKPSMFYKVGSESDQIGFIAQEVAEIFPQCVHTSRQYIPNISCPGKIRGKTITVNKVLTTDDLIVGDILKVENRARVENRELRVTGLEIETDEGEPMTRIHVEPGSDRDEAVFVYGKLVDDFHMINCEQMVAIMLTGIRILHDKNARIKEKMQSLQPTESNIG